MWAQLEVSNSTGIIYHFLLSSSWGLRQGVPKAHRGLLVEAGRLALCRHEDTGRKCRATHNSTTPHSQRQAGHEAGTARGKLHSTQQKVNYIQQLVAKGKSHSPSVNSDAIGRLYKPGGKCLCSLRIDKPGKAWYTTDKIKEGRTKQ
jgi:hypothetical protein